MPTIIDSFIIQFGIDPKGVEEGRKKVDDNLEQLDDRVGRTGRAVDDTGKNFVSFLRAIGAPMQAVRRRLEEIVTAAQPAKTALDTVSAQARRTGAGVEAGALAGAGGLRVMAGAGLAAFAALEGVHKIFRAISGSTEKTFGASVGAAAAGMGVRGFSAVAQALNIAGNAPETDTESWLASIRQFQENLKIGIVDQHEMARLGILGLNPLSSPQEMMRQLAARFAGERPETAISQGSSVGLTPEQSLALRKLGPGFGAAVAAQRPTAITEQDVQAATNYLRAVKAISTEWEAFTREMVTDIAPLLTQFLKGLKDQLELLTGKKSIGDFFSYHWHGFLSQHPGIAHALGLSARAPTGAAPTGDMAVGGNWEVQHNNFAGMRRPGVVAGPNSGGFQSFPTPEAGVQAIQRQLGRYISGATTGRPLTTLRQMIMTWAPPSDHNPTAALIARASRIVGIGPDDPIDWSNPAIRAKVIEAFIRNEQGGRLPNAAASAISRVVAGGDGGNAQALVNSARSGSASSSAVAPASVTTNTATIGDIHVHTAATDGPGVVASIRDAINRNLLVAQANMGLA